MESGDFTDNSTEDTCPSEETEEETEEETDVDFEGNINVSAKGGKKKGKKKDGSSKELKEASSSKSAALRRSGNKRDALRISQGFSMRSSENSRKQSRRYSLKKPAQTKKGKKARFFGEIEDTVEKEPEIPEGLIPILLSIKTQEHFGLRIGEDVTADDPQKFILKRDIMQDIEDFKEKSDFSSIIDMIQDYTAEEFLIVYDYEFKYGQNFFITVSEDARDMFAKDSLTSELEDFAIDFFGPYEAPKPKEWTSLGSEKEIQDWTVTNQRDYIKMLLKRDVKYFGAPTNFSDSNPVESKNFVDILSVPAESSELRRMEVDVGVQAVPEFTSHHTQKIQGLMVNKVVQCMPRELTEEEAQEIMESQEFEDFFNRVIPRVDKELQQNKIVDVFFDDWDRLSDGNTDFAAKSEKHLKEHQSFTDLQYGKSRAVSCITWHPTIPLIVAVSLIDNVTLYERIEQAHKQFTPPLILIWNFSDPIHPILVLECPEQVMCFQFCPTNPSFVVGGCFNGQVVLWDLSYHTERLKVLPGAKKKDILRELSAEFDWAKAQSSVRFCAISSVEHSHSLPITDILWIPSQYEINKFGYVSQNKFDHNIQLITCGIDQSIMFWDIRMPKGSLPVMTKKELQKICLIPGTFKHLDLVWRPFLKLSTSKAEIGNDYSPIKFSIAEAQPIHSVDTLENVNVHSSIILNPGIKPISSKFFIGTEEGEVMYLDWMPQKDQESGKYQTQRPIFAHQVHDGAVMSLVRSPFFEDILLTVGGWNFAIWKEGINVGPIIKGYGPKRFTAGHWSTTRPAVFYLAKVDGTIDVWDLLDRTHEACYTQNISTSQITTISSIKIKSLQSSGKLEPMHLLAVGDENGTLYLLELPWSLCNPSLSELANMTAYLDKEAKHLAYVNSRWVVRDDERNKQDMEMKRMKNQEAEPPPVPSEEELEAKERMEYEAFLEEEQAFLKLMGLVEDRPPSLLKESDKKGSMVS